MTLDGEESLPPIAKEVRWRNDQFMELNNDDALWAYMIRASEEFQMIRWDEVNDPVLRRLMRMGIFDWKTPDTRLHQATQAMRHGTAMSTRILGRVLQGENKVTRVQSSPINGN
jgi:hypothetical protein